ncbi:pirin family protein [Candidatus Poribacteria bacterium]
MNSVRQISKVLRSRPTIEGAGVHLKRAFGYYEVPLLDPFLMLDDFHSDNSDDYIAGFPWHPHRGIETVTYMLHGKVEHGDSIGNSGVIESGDVQWMTAGSGIIHSEMPKASRLLWGFQLWVNLPASHKMMEPRYQDVKKDQIPEVSLGDAKIKIICGEVDGVKGPVHDIMADPEYLDITMPPHKEFGHCVKRGHKVFAYVAAGEGHFAPHEDRLIREEHLVIFKDGDVVEISSGDSDLRFLLISGKPIGEPVAWRGPIVMNTQEELETAFEEYRNGTFTKHK